MNQRVGLEHESGDGDDSRSSAKEEPFRRVGPAFSIPVPHSRSGPVVGGTRQITDCEAKRRMGNGYTRRLVRRVRAKVRIGESNQDAEKPSPDSRIESHGPFFFAREKGHSVDE